MGGLREPVNSGAWDPENSWMPDEEFQTEFQSLLARADGLASEVRSLADEIRRRMLDVSLPIGMEPDWVDGPKSPVFYLTTAAGYLVTSAYGAECWQAFPKSDFHPDPPPQDKWSCDHYPRHSRP